MSYWIYLRNKDGENVTVDAHAEGGTHVMGGTDEAELNVTYNYGVHIHKYLKGGLKYLHKKKGKSVIKKLEKAVKELGTERSDNYWDSTEGNAGYALNILLGWAKQHPEAKFEVS